MKILVTGAAGFIGSHIYNYLINNKYKVYGIDNLSRGNIKKIIDKQNFSKIDIRDKKGILKFLKKKGPFDVIIHQATIINENIQSEDIEQDIDINLKATLNLINLACKFGLKRFIYASSISVYGKIRNKLATESIKEIPINSYGICKLMVEKYINYLRKYKFNKLDYVILRYSNVYGPNQSDLGEVGVIRNFCKQIINKKKIFRHGSGKQIRDFIYISDVIDATIKSITTKNINSIYNICSGNSKSINYIISILKKISTVTFKVNFKKKFHDSEYFYFKASNKLAYKKLKWRPKISLKQGIQNTFQNINEKKYKN